MTSSRTSVAWRADAVLSDGAVATVRTIEPDDPARLGQFASGVSEDSLRFRYFFAHRELSQVEREAMTRPPTSDQATLVAAVGGAIVGVASYERLSGTAEAEVAFLVADAYHGHGVATLLLEHLASIARQYGLERFVASTLPDNRRMLQLFQAAGYAAEQQFADGVVQVSLDLEPTEATLDAIGRREQLADAASLRRVLRPGAIAVVGAGRRAGTIGHEVLRSLLLGEFNGPVYPVNPAADHVCGVRAYPTLGEVPGPVDLVVVTVPAGAVAGALEDAGAIGAAGVVVISAGFAEVGGDGRSVEQHLVEIARKYGMRLIGPNCMGVLNTAPDVRMNATFAPSAPAAGRIGLLSQSGALGIAVLSRAARSGIGISTFVSVGNKADVSGNDLLQYWEDDADTDVAMLYLESFGNPRKFARIARRVARRKPVVAVKSGRTAAGQSAASSHTAAAATPEVAVDALFRQSGVVRVDTLPQLFDVARMLTLQPMPHGRRVAIVGNSGGPGILAADACDAAGLEVPELAPATQAAMSAFLPSGAALRNPVDLVAAATPEAYSRAVEAVLADDGIDAVVVICTPTLVTDIDAVADVIRERGAAAAKTLIACFVGLDDPPTALGDVVPSYPFPEPAVAALGLVSAYAEWRRRPQGTVPPLAGIDRQRARSLVADFLAEHPNGGWVPPDTAIQLVHAYGIPATDARSVSDPDGAAAAAATLGGTVVLKAAGPDLVHKSDSGGVRLGLTSPEQVRAAYADMADRLGDAMTSAIVQPQLGSGVETVVGVVHDESFGPLVMFGLGGVTTDLLGDRAFRILPVTDLDAAELVRSLRASPLLFGYRGTPRVAVEALEELIARVGRLAGDLPELAELDLNPVIVSADGVAPVDVKLRLAPRTAPDPLLRRLR
jgi:acetyl coenzyme A synthetase (ADP forming)-like protein